MLQPSEFRKRSEQSSGLFRRARTVRANWSIPRLRRAMSPSSLPAHGLAGEGQAHFPGHGAVVGLFQVGVHIQKGGGVGVGLSLIHI